MKINKLFKYFILYFLFVLFFTVNVNAQCKYKDEIQQCKKANDSWTSRSIEDFVCIIGSPEEISYQIVLDWLFKELDDEMDEYIENLEKDKTRYYWKDREKNFIDWLNEVDLQKKYFLKEYSNICGAKIIWELVLCMDDLKTSTRNSKDYFLESDCMLLVKKKLEIYDDVTFSILMLNKQQVKADEKKTYVQWERKNYDVLLDIMMINLSYIERIWQKWPSKIQNAY